MAQDSTEKQIPEFEISKSEMSDFEDIQRLDSSLFPENSLDFEPASEDELRFGVSRGEIFLARAAGKAVAFIHFEAIGSTAVNLVSLAVSPDFQGRGVGKALMKFMDDSIGNGIEEVTCVTSPRNGSMIKVLLNSNFVGTALVKDYFGQGKDRLVFKRRKNSEEYLLGGSDFVPLESPEAIVTLMNYGDRQISRMHLGAQGHLLEIARTLEINLADARNNEASTSVSQAAGILSALTFLLGFSFVLETFSIYLRMFLIIAVVATVGAVQVYANSTGSVLRAKDSSFDSHMKMGNLLLDFGGHYPLIIVMPAIFVSFNDPLAPQLVVAAAVSFLLLLYELSPYSIFSRYKQGFVNMALMVTTAVLPLISVWSQYIFASQLEWILIALTVLAIRFGLHSLRRITEGTSKTRKQLLS
jgi:ribosomal protein S18 acetylase RimI-like enzyme